MHCSSDIVTRVICLHIPKIDFLKPNRYHVCFVNHTFKVFPTFVNVIYVTIF